MLKSAVYGAAVGDALGVPYEFCGRDSFACTGMASGGAHEQPAGTFSDDTSMMLATCDSIRARGRIDVADIRKRFEAWFHRGEYAVDGRVFDVGSTVANAIMEGVGRDGERSNGNGSLMRIAPLAFADASDDDIRDVSAITHAHRVSAESCVCYVHVARELADGAGIREAVARNVPHSGEFAFLEDVCDWPRGKVRSGGYVLETLGAAFWCAANTKSYSECVLEAVNLGHDADTTACVAGALAGIAYGVESIPPEWMDALRGRDIIEMCLF